MHLQMPAVNIKAFLEDLVIVLLLYIFYAGGRGWYFKNNSLFLEVLSLLAFNNFYKNRS